MGFCTNKNTQVSSNKPPQNTHIQKKIGDYNTSHKKKRLLDEVYRHVMSEKGNIDDTFLVYCCDVYGIRRKRAVFNYLEHAENMFSSLNLDSFCEDFAIHELMPNSNYNFIDNEADLRIAATLFILKKLSASQNLNEAYKILQPLRNADFMCLPPDFSHPCYANELIESVVQVLTFRYEQNSNCGAVITKQNAQGQKANKTYTDLIALLPKESIDAACEEFKSKLLEISARFLKGNNYYVLRLEKLLNKIAEKRSFNQNAQLNAVAEQSPLTSMFHDNDVSFPYETPPLFSLEQEFQSLLEMQKEFYVNFDDGLMLDRDELEKIYSAEVIEALDNFYVEDPYALCFALFYLIDNDDDAPWIMTSGSTLMNYCLHMLPWYVDPEKCTDEELNGRDLGMSYNKNNWMGQEAVADIPDYYHIKHRGRNLSQLIYSMCRGVVPSELHPFAANKKNFIAEGMDEALATKITDIAELMFLQTFQAKPRAISDGLFSDVTFEQQKKEHAGDFENKNAEDNASKLENDNSPILCQDRETISKEDVKEDLKDKLNVNSNSLLQGTEEEQAVFTAIEHEKLKEELNETKAQVKNLLRSLATLRHETDDQILKYERELKALRMEHRELSDLREIFFKSNMSSTDKLSLEKTECEYTYPYKPRKRTIIFGGHESWLKALRPLIPEVKFVDIQKYAFNPEIIKNAEVVWIQNNCISHAQYYRIVRICRIASVQLRYFAYEGAMKCAEQLIEWDSK